jgi:hypothetical protein
MKLTFFLFLLGLQSLYAQSSDTVIVSSPPEHSPKKATLMSAVLPGLGQAYNKKYWKIPLVYAALGTAYYFVDKNIDEFKDFKSAYVKRIDDDPATMDTKYDNVYTDQQLLRLIDDRRRNRDLSYVALGVAYILNIVDAAVDAHLYYFNVSDDLSMRVAPAALPYAQNHFAPGLQLSLNIGKRPIKQSINL